MGLDFTHCDARWGYGGFMRFRCRLADEIGVGLESMEGFTSSLENLICIARREKPTRDDMQPYITSWDALKPDPIIPLLSHSDCDGELTPEQCRSIAPRLRELVKDWKDDDYDKQHALELAKGMELAFSLNQPLEFI